jgi:hypothetical protein
MLTPATITVSFIANYAGLHRICWRVCNTGTYSCTNIVECEGGGNPCNAVISIMVDPESCDPVCYEGYIQATCNAIDSPIGQVPFTVTYTPTPTCVGWTITCNNPEGCPAILPTEIGLNCNGTLRPQIEAMLEGETLSLCNRFEIPTLPTDYSMELDATVTCCTCESYNVNFTTQLEPTPPFTNVYLYYTNCEKELVKISVSSPSTINSICAVPGSVSATGTLLGWNLIIAEGTATCP